MIDLAQRVHACLSGAAGPVVLGDEGLVLVRVLWFSAADAAALLEALGTGLRGWRVVPGEDGLEGMTVWVWLTGANR